MSLPITTVYDTTPSQPGQLYGKTPIAHYSGHDDRGARDAIDHGTFHPIDPNRLVIEQEWLTPEQIVQRLAGAK